MYFCQPLPTLKQLNLLCSNFPKQFALRLLPELQHLHPKDERGGVPRLWLRVCRAEAPAERSCLPLQKKWEFGSLTSPWLRLGAPRRM